MNLDVRKLHPGLYKPPTGDFVEVDVPPMTYLAIDGHGDPNTDPAYAEALQTLYPAVYGVRAGFKGRTGQAWVVGPLEALWSADDPATFTNRSKSEWDWTLLIPVPGAITEEDIAAGLASAAARKPDVPIARVHALTLHEGRSLQILHVGSYDDEGPALARLHHELMPAGGLTFNGRHHEIYLNDPRRVAPEKLRTILRQPVVPVG